MKLLLFASLEKDKERLETCVQALVHISDVESIASFDEFTQRLRRPLNACTLAVVMINDREELEKMLSAKNLFDGLKAILIVPDRKAETISLALKLRPRYMSYSDGDLYDVALVVKHMFNRFQMAKQLPVHEKQSI